MSTNFQVKNFVRLRTLFKKKGWDNFTGEDYTFESLTQLLCNLNESEQDLILDLTERYLWIENASYVPLLRDVLSEATCNADIGSYQNIYFFPVIKPKDQNKTKSGNLLIYLIDGVRRLLNEPLKNKKFIVLENFSDVMEDKLQLGDDDVFVLVDDFLGTGETVKSTLKIVQENSSIKSEKIRVVGFTALQMSIDVLNSLNIRSYMIHILSKGISSVYGSEVEKKLGMMKKIERMSVAPPGYKLGFKKSEGLVTMARTPNNTFSIFWSNHIKDEVEFLAPFPRF